MRDERVVGVLVGPGQSGGRHVAGAQLADDPLPFRRVRRGILDRETGKGEAAASELFVVAADAIPAYCRLLRGGG